MKEIRIGNRCYIELELLNEIGNIKHGFTTAKGGYSVGRFEGLNLGFRVGDEKETVLKNYKTVAKDLGLSYENIVIANQMHTDNIRVIKEEDKGKGVTKESDINDTDGLITDIKNIPLGVYTADCFPILLAEKSGKAVGAVHSGRKGTVKKIAGKAVVAMKEAFDINPDEIVAVIGPGIENCCLEVGEDVFSFFEDDCRRESDDGKVFVDLRKTIKRTLLSAGLREEDIKEINECTCCSQDKYYSWRRMKGEATGRIGAFIEIK